MELMLERLSEPSLFDRITPDGERKGETRGMSSRFDPASLYECSIG